MRIVIHRIDLPVTHASARRRGGSLSMSSRSPGASVLKSPVTRCRPCWCRSTLRKQRAQFVRAPLLGQVAVHGAQMHAVDAEVGRRHDLEVGAFGPADPPPDVSRNRQPAHERDRVSLRRCPMLEAARLGELLHHGRAIGLLQNDDVRLAGGDDCRQRRFAADAPFENVVAENPQRLHGSWMVPKSVR